MSLNGEEAETIATTTTKTTTSAATAGWETFAATTVTFLLLLFHRDFVSNNLSKATHTHALLILSLSLSLSLSRSLMMNVIKALVWTHTIKFFSALKLYLKKSLLRLNWIHFSIKALAAFIKTHLLFLHKIETMPRHFIAFLYPQCPLNENVTFMIKTLVRVKSDGILSQTSLFMEQL